MSVISWWALQNAAGEIRAADAALRAAVAQLVATSVWTGADAERFQREWDDLVSGRLQAAAAKVDGVSLTEFVTP